MTADVSIDAREFLRAARVLIDAGDSSAGTARSLRLALQLAGGEETVSEPSRARVLTFKRLRQFTTIELDALRERAAGEPVLVCPSDAGDVRLDAHVQGGITHLAGERLDFTAPAPSAVFTFDRSDRLWPFAGATLEETAPRTLSAIDIRSNGRIEPLVSTDRGSVFFKLRSRRVYVTLVPISETADDGLLKHQLTPATFMGLVPLLLFLRDALGERGWLRPSVRATFMVDDPNLRLARYGFLDLRRLIDAAREHRFHTSIGMIPLDFRKTRRRTAELFLRHTESVSIVPHGVDHVWGEFATDVSLEIAESMLYQGLLRMEEHKRGTGIGYPRAVTFPHGLGNATWMRAMRNVGLDGTFNKESFPFCDESEIDEALYEMHPAEMTFLGFPVIKRFQAELQEERLLFAALLGKPLVIYTHHDFFREGLDRLVSIAEFVNRLVSPEWVSAEEILRTNYQVRRAHEGFAVRAFSNRIELPGGDELPARVVLKAGAGFPADEECRVGSNIVPLTELADGLCGTLPAYRRDREVTFGPARRPLDPAALRRPRLRSRTRRWATEFRDQAVLPALAHFSRR